MAEKRKISGSRSDHQSSLILWGMSVSSVPERGLVEVRQRHPEKHDGDVDRPDHLQDAPQAELLCRHLGELEGKHAEVQERAPADFVERGGRRPGHEHHPHLPRAAELHHEHGDRAHVAEERHQHRGAKERMVAVRAQHLHEAGDGEADPADGDHGHDPVADPPAPGIGVVDVGDAADADGEPHHRDDDGDRHDGQQRLVPPGEPDAPVHAVSGLVLPAAVAPVHKPRQHREHAVEHPEHARRDAQPAVGEVRHRRLRQARDVADLLERYGGQVQHARAPDLVEAVDLGDVRARGHRDPPLCFGHHVVAVPEADGAGGAHLAHAGFSPPPGGRRRTCTCGWQGRPAS